MGTVTTITVLEGRYLGPTGPLTSDRTWGAIGALVMTVRMSLRNRELLTSLHQLGTNSRRITEDRKP